MKINADFTQNVSIHPAEYQWTPSTQQGVTRMMLDRIGAEKARATSLVEYAEQAVFPAHEHPGGEEILVLSGTFSDEAGDFPRGWYVRNPPQSSHTPGSKEGTLIFVKLWQMHPDDRQFVRVNTEDPSSWVLENGRRICPLYSNFDEIVSLEQLSPDETLFDRPVKPVEILVVSGELTWGQDKYPKGSWLRLVQGEYPDICASSNGAFVYLKEGPFKNILLMDF